MLGVENMDLILVESNRYREKNFPRIAIIKDWEIVKLMGICLYISIVRQPNYHMYWSANMRDKNVADMGMTRDRFANILRCLHFSDNDFDYPRGHPEYDRLSKIRPFF